MAITNKFLFLALVIIIMILGGCAKNVQLYRQAVKEYNQGQYEKALDNSVRSLELKRSYAKAQTLIQKSFPKVIAAHEARVIAIKAEAGDDMWDQLVAEYQALTDLQKKVEPFTPFTDPETGDTLALPLRDYTPELQESTRRAAEYHYDKAVQLAGSGDTPDIQKQAVEQFQLVQKYDPNYKDSSARYAAARRMAVKRIAILDFEDRSGVRKKYGSIVDLLTGSIIGGLLQDAAATEFMEIVTRDQIDAVMAERQLSSPNESNEALATNLGVQLGADEVLTGKILQINYVEPRITSLEQTETKTIEVKQEVVDDKGKKKNQKVPTEIACSFNKYSKSASVKIIASFSIIEVSTGRVKLQDTVSADFPWSDIWIRDITGDQRALTPASQALANKAEPLPPSEVEMVNSALSILSINMVDQVRNYVK